MNISSKTFIITGTTKGLGEAFVDIILKKGDDKIVSLSRNITKAQERFVNDRFIFIKIDLSKAKDLEHINFLKKVIKTKEIVFINNAGTILPITKIGNLKSYQIAENLNVNVLSPLIICNLLLNEFKESKITMINITSGAASIPIENWSLYCSAKAATQMFFNVLAKEYPNHSFLNIDPGVLDTDMQTYIRNSDFKNVNDFIKFKEDGILKKPNEVAYEILKNYL